MKFTPTAQNPIEYNYRSKSVAVGDFDNDARLDLVVANYATDSISIFFGLKDGTFSKPVRHSTGSGSAPYMVTVGDFNNDHQLDLAIAIFGRNSIIVFLGGGNRTFVNQTTLLTNSSRPVWINVADLNNDATLDMIIANYGTHSITVFYGCGNGTFNRFISLSTAYDSLPFAVVAGDFNNDKQLDLVTANYGTDNIGVFLSSGNDIFESQTVVSTGLRSRPYSVVVGHFNNDTVLDIAVANYGTNNIGIFLGYGNGTFASQTTYSTGTSSPYFIGIGDFNNDYRLDLVVSNQGSNNIGVLLGYGNGTFTSPKMYSTGSSSSTSVGIGDFNNDNRLDIAVVNNDTNSIDFLYGYDEGLANPVMYATSSAPVFVAVGDFNNDNHLDIIAANSYMHTINIFLGYGDGSFAGNMTYSADFYPQSLAVGNINNDTYLDIVVANNADHTVSILLGIW